MKVTKIIQLIENINEYHAVNYDDTTGEVIVRRADFMALAVLVDNTGEESHEVVPLVFDENEGELYIAPDALLAKPGMDALKIIAPDISHKVNFSEWLDFTGITELIVPGGDR